MLGPKRSYRVNQMYPYYYLSQLHPVEPNEVFVAMPFDPKYDDIYNKIIELAVNKANKLLKRNSSDLLFPYRTKDDPKTILGWEEVLKHLTSAGLVLGVLTDLNPNVFYELGIAHATQPLVRQVLLAPSDYKPVFDIKDVITVRYELDKIDAVIEELATKIETAIIETQIYDDERITKAKKMMGPREFGIALKYGKMQNFAFSLKAQSVNFDPVVEAEAAAMDNLCRLGLLALITAKYDDNPEILHFSYWWTRLGNEVLALKDFGIIDCNEVKRRKGSCLS